MEFSGGWDSEASLVDGRWVERRPRRPEVVDQLRRETRLMPWLAPRLPLRVPVPEILEETPLVVRHELVPGEPLSTPTAAHGGAIGSFLRALHDCSVTDAIAHGLRATADAAFELGRTLDRFRAEVVPLLPVERSKAGLALLDAARHLPADTLVHGDLGPAHVLTTDAGLAGVIDFGDARNGDAALDLAWALHGTPPAFAGALASVYGVTDGQRERALVWHRLGPWHEVTHGLDIGDDGLVRSGLAGVLDRLELRPTAGA